jgi:hypothetical protein
MAGLTSGSFAKYRAFVGAEGIARLTLSYDKATDEILPSSAGGALALSIGAKNFTDGLIPDQLVGHPEIRRRLLGDFPGIDGPREVTVTLTIGRIYDQLEGLARELKAHFAGPLESITVDGVLAIVDATSRPPIRRTTSSSRSARPSASTSTSAARWARARRSAPTST